MTQGALIFAHNSRKIDYALLALISGGLAKKNLNIPVSLITDPTTIDWMKESNIFEKSTKIFDQIIITAKPETNNTRKLHDGIETQIVPFVNTNRSDVWDLTPYNRTLLLDSDFLIFSDRLNEYWEVNEDILIADAMNDICDNDRAGYHDKYISDTGIHMFWATTVMFTKNEKSKSFFKLVDYIRDHYQYYADLFRFDPRQYRNDIAFSVAKHIINGFETIKSPSLPSLLTAIDRDMLSSVDQDGKLTLLISPMLDEKFVLASITNTDLHIMNKQSIIRNAESLLRLI
jgi:hypothetical protein